MSKNKQTNATEQVARPINMKALIISIVCIITVLVIAVSLTIALWPQPADKTLADTDTPTIDSSTDTIKNGNFDYIKEEATMYPLSAQSWDKYTFKSTTTSSQYYNKIMTNDKTVMGIVDTSDWTTVSSDLAKYGITLTNPEKPVSDSEDSNVYMINNLQEYTASIYSQSFSVPASSSAKITVWLKTVDVTGHGAFVMVKQSSTYAQEKSTSGTQYWYMHKGVQEGQDGINTNGQWQQFEFYFFNQTSSSKTLYFNVGLGNIYNNQGAKGTLFIDEIKYETVTADDYRRVSGLTDGTVYTAEKETEDNQVEKAPEFVTTGASATTMTATEYLAGNLSLYEDKHYSPFVDENTNIISVSNDGSVATQVAVKSNANIPVEGPSIAQHYLISLWVRVINQDNSVLPNANIYLYESGNDKTPLASFTSVRTSSDLAKDDNNGWAQYHFYIKPAQASKDLYILVSFGDKNGYPNTGSIPKGTLLVTQPTKEFITQADYGNATTGDTVSKVSLDNIESTTTISNASFSNIVNNSDPNTPATYAPADWNPVYAGSVELTKNGVDNVTVDTTVGSVTSNVLYTNTDTPAPVKAPTFDDNAKAVLQITNNRATSFGYLSADISLSAKTVYVISVLARGDGKAVPSVYLIDNSDENNVSLSYKASTITTKANDDNFNYPTDADWTRYYFIVATGDTAKTVNLALFNGLMDATKDSGTQTGTVYFDQALVSTLGTYTRDFTADQLYTKGDDGNWVLDEEKAKDMTYTATAGYEELDKLLDSLKVDGKYVDNVQVIDNRLTDIATPTEDEDDGDTPSDTNTNQPVDVTLVVSIVISALLLGALIIVVLTKFVFPRKTA